MMDEDNQCSLDGLDEQNKLTIDCLPAEVLAICLSYTGKDLPNVRLTCRRFNQIIEDYQYMMNVIPLEKMIIRKDEYQDFFPIEQVTFKCSEFGSNKTICKLDQVMKYIRFLRPGRLYINKHSEAKDMKKYLTDSWRKGIVNLYSSEPLLSIFPNVRVLNTHCPPNQRVILVAHISAHPSPIRRFRLNSLDPGVFEENALILDALSKNSNKFNGGMEDVHLNASCSMEAIIRFLENSMFAEKFRMFAWVNNYNEYRFDPVQGDVYVENSGYQKFNNWLRSKGIPQPSDNGEFVYRLTQFSISFKGI